MHTLALGTVQFGLRYGVANRRGKVDTLTAGRILDLARERGIDTIDTAVTYGDSESCLGMLGVSDLRVISKVPPLPDGVDDVGAGDWLRRSVEASLTRLKVSRLYGLLLHRSCDLASVRGEELYAALTALKDEGYVERIGVSIYDPDELAALTKYRLGLVQAPFNVFDRRLVTSGAAVVLRAQGAEIHARSALLQGLLTIPLGSLPAPFLRWADRIDGWHRWVGRVGSKPALAAIAFAVAASGADRVVVGVDDVDQLREILSATEHDVGVPPDWLQCDDRELVDPSRWPPL